MNTETIVILAARFANELIRAFNLPPPTASDWARAWEVAETPLMQDLDAPGKEVK